MGFVSAFLGLVGFGVGIGIGILIGFYLFIYSKSTDVEDPSGKSIQELDSEALESLLADIPLWVKSPDYDRVDWLNKFISEMWPYLDKAVCCMVRSMANKMFEEYKRMYSIESIDFKTLTLGNIPPTVHGVKIIEIHERQLVLEPAIRWVGNPNITLSLRVLSLNLTFQVVDVQIFMSPRVTLKPLVPSFPCFGNINISLLEKPNVDFGFRVLGGDIMAIPGLYHYVQKIIRDQVSSLYIWPKVLDVPILDAKTGAMHKPVGLLHAKVVRASNLCKMDLFGKSDPYVKLSLIGERLPSKKTSIKMRTLNPEWNELFKLIVKDPESQTLQLRVYDWEKVGTHDKLGMQVIPLKSLVPHEAQVFNLSLLKNLNQNDPQNKENRGQITVELTFEPFVEDTDRLSGSLTRENTNGTSVRVHNESSNFQEGLLLVSLLSAEDVEGNGHTNPYAEIVFRGETKKTKVVRKTRDPIWNEEFQFMLDDPKSDERIHIAVISKRTKYFFRTKELLGHVDIILADILNNGRISQMYHLINSRNGKLHVELRWQSVGSVE